MPNYFLLYIKQKCTLKQLYTYTLLRRPIVYFTTNMFTNCSISKKSVSFTGKNTSLLQTLLKHHFILILFYWELDIIFYLLNVFFFRVLVFSVLCNVGNVVLILLRGYLLERDPPPPTLKVENHSDGTIFLY